jgi:hypothetical protein
MFEGKNRGQVDLFNKKQLRPQRFTLLLLNTQSEENFRHSYVHCAYLSSRRHETLSIGPPPVRKMKLCIFAQCAKQECASLSRMRTKMSIFCYLRKTNVCMYSKCAHFVYVFRKHTMNFQFITSAIRKPKSKSYIIFFFGGGGCRCIDLFVW